MKKARNGLNYILVSSNREMTAKGFIWYKHTQQGSKTKGAYERPWWNRVPEESPLISGPWIQPQFVFNGHLQKKKNKPWLWSRRYLHREGEGRENERRGKEEIQCGKTGKENGTGITFKTVVTGKLLMFHRRVNIQYYMGSTNCTWCHKNNRG